MKNPKIQTEEGETPNLPYSKIQIGDIIIAKYKNSAWADNLPWENYHHAGLISEINGEEIKIIETPGGNKNEDKKGPMENKLKESGFNLSNKKLIELILLKPKFPNPIREKGKWFIPRIFHKKISEKEARKRIVEYARNQEGETYKEFSSKWNEEQWYCSKLIYKSYSMTIYDMYLEKYQKNIGGIRGKLSSGYWVTPEDLVDSKRTEIYYNFKKINE